ncbi:hypothetical protein [Micromonospora vulcania]|uniref:Uncharacterized protein n=1 Tax=Micromonospora vulcania TaxID=1441873 RepID=A0ABW1H1E7_9ACTN
MLAMSLGMTSGAVGYQSLRSGGRGVGAVRDYAGDDEWRARVLAGLAR